MNPEESMVVMGIESPGGIEFFQGTFEENIEIDRLDPAEEFLNRGEMG